MNTTLLTIDIRYEEDVVLIRQRARQIAALLNLNMHDQTAFATGVSELARNAFRYAGGGKATFSVRGAERPVLEMCVQDKGPGIADLKAVLEGQYVSETGLGIGIVGAQRLSDEFDIQSSKESGTTAKIGKFLPKRSQAITPQLISSLTADLAQRSPRNALEEVQEQNKELLQTLDELRARQADVERLNSELGQTNRGVVALYAELDEKAASLQRASEHKSRFLSDMTHELRTPLNAIISISRLLLDRLDGDLSSEQEKQVTLIHRSATSLGEMVNDLLDLAKIEAGKIDLYVSEFSVENMLSALRGMFRPIAGNARAVLRIDNAADVATMRTDERKLSQILRNLISNAMKFTEQGEVRVRTLAGEDGEVVFAVSDTGIGIEAQNLDLIFQDFTQIDSSIQRTVRGTGLGLPLTRKLARLLGGDVTVSSEVGAGSTFTVALPRVYTPGGGAGGKDGQRDFMLERRHG